MKILTSLFLILIFLSGCQTLDSLDRGSFGSFERLKNNTAHGYNIIDTKLLKKNFFRSSKKKI